MSKNSTETLENFENTGNNGPSRIYTPVLTGDAQIALGATPEEEKDHYAQLEKYTRDEKGLRPLDY